MDLPPDPAPSAITPPTVDWPTPNPELAHALVGSILAAQGFTPSKDKGPGSPWLLTEFDRCAPWIAAALKGQNLTVEEVREGVRFGWLQLFHTHDGVMVSEVMLSPRIRAVHVLAAGGTLRAMEELTAKVEMFARLAGCNYGGATGRKGWVRWLRRFGYAPPTQVTVEKAL